MNTIGQKIWALSFGAFLGILILSGLIFGLSLIWTLGELNCHLYPNVCASHMGGAPDWERLWMNPWMAIIQIGWLVALIGAGANYIHHIDD
jgi:hypothetical protein